MFKRFFTTNKDYINTLTHNLLSETSQRVSHLEWQIRILQESERRLKSIKVFLEVGEKFRMFNKGLKVQGDRIREILEHHDIRKDDLGIIEEVCKYRNHLAHPNNRTPDLTNADPNVARAFDKIQRFLADPKVSK